MNRFIKNKLTGLLLLCAITMISCSDNKTAAPETALDAGRVFIRASLDGNFKDAEALLLKDSMNTQLFESYKQYYNRLADEKKRNYKAASYVINKYEDVNDSTTVINYSNSYMNKPMEIKLVRDARQWLVDFKYTYSGNLPID